MNNPVRVNSFARTGNMFLETVLIEYLGYIRIDPMTYKENYHIIDILSDRSIPQLVILRNPVDCIVSNKIYRAYTMLPKEYTMLRSVLDWLEWHITFLKNIDILYPLTFEQVTESTEKCLKTIKDQFYGPDFKANDVGLLPNNFKAQINQRNNIFQTSKTSKDYEDVLSSYYAVDSRLIEMVDEVYIALKEKVMLRQSSLSWTL
jgi:hypothetical protein